MGQEASVARVSQLSHITLGGVIRAYRLRRRSQTGQPFSQEELAFASGTDQAHISRIESDQKHPQYSTLCRICDALELSLVEREYLLGLAGYEISPPLPDEKTIEAVVSKLAPLIETYPYPAEIMDESERVWHLNDMGTMVWAPRIVAISRLSAFGCRTIVVIVWIVT